MEPAPACSQAAVAQAEVPAGAAAPEDEEALAALLREGGADPEKYGAAGAKSLSALLAEIAAGECSLRWQQGALERLVEPVFVQLLWRDRVLVEAEQRFLDGRRRRRNMVLAEKRAASDADAAFTALRGIVEELDLTLDAEALPGLVRFHMELYDCVTERRESPSYPGLHCAYVSHHVVVELNEAGEAHFAARGLLEERFETAEKDKVNVWQWMPLRDAIVLQVKGISERGASAHGGPIVAFTVAGDTAVAQPAPLDAAQLGKTGVSEAAPAEPAPAETGAVEKASEEASAESGRAGTPSDADAGSQESAPATLEGEPGVCGAGGGPAPAGKASDEGDAGQAAEPGGLTQPCGAAADAETPSARSDCVP